MDKKYNEFEVKGRLVNRKFVIDKKELTERGHVMISEREAATNNNQTRFNGLHYELAVKAETEEEKAKRKELFRVVRKELNLTVPNTTTTEELEKLIADNKK